MMTEHDAITNSEKAMVMSSMEREQLAGVAKAALPRRKLKGAEKFVLWFLRLYLLFMMAVVAYQVWQSTH